MDGKLDEIKKAPSTKAIAADYDVTYQTIVNFLTRHGVDHRQFKRQSKWVENPAKSKYSKEA